MRILRQEHDFHVSLGSLVKGSLLKGMGILRQEHEFHVSLESLVKGIGILLREHEEPNCDKG